MSDFNDIDFDTPPAQARACHTGLGYPDDRGLAGHALHRGIFPDDFHEPEHRAQPLLAQSPGGAPGPHAHHHAHRHARHLDPFRHSLHPAHGYPASHLHLDLYAHALLAGASHPHAQANRHDQTQCHAQGSLFRQGGIHLQRQVSPGIRLCLAGGGGHRARPEQCPSHLCAGAPDRGAGRGTHQ